MLRRPHEKSAGCLPGKKGLKKATQMTQVTIQEAMRALPGLLAAANAGENVTILDESGKTFRLVATHERPAITGVPTAGRWEGRLVVPDDFDEPLDDLREYME
jgi:antitoxin (DNA-binding transcriptional repressor) of toxin-antitoxin stability system